MTIPKAVRWALVAGAFRSGAALAEIDYRKTASLIVRNVAVIDGRGGPASGLTSIRIVDGVIAEISPAIAGGDGTPAIDGGGATVVPGLIDAHVHLRSTPGSVFRRDGEATYRELVAAQLRAYVASGVTAVVDAAAPLPLLQSLRAYYAADGVGPAVSYLAPVLTPEGGYFGNKDLRDAAYDDMWTPIAHESEIAPLLARGADIGQIGAKVMVEAGFGPIEVWPVFDRAARGEIRAEADRQHLALFVHSMDEEEHEMAFDLRPRGFMHAGYTHETPSADVLARFAASGAFVVSTLAIYDMALIEWDRERLDEPWMTRAIPAAELATARDDEVWARAKTKMALVNSPKWVPEIFVQALTGLFFNEGAFRSQLESSGRAVRALHAAGVPIVMGSDSGCWPVMPYMFHGVSSVREVELLNKAGLSPLEALTAATATAAKMIGIERVAGTIAVGMRADMVVVDGDPLQDLARLRHPKWVIRRGVAKTPAEWLATSTPLFPPKGP